jgi:hypothetical protein
VKRLMLRQQGQIAMTGGALLVAAAVGALNGFWFGVMFLGFAAMAWGIIAVITEYSDR